MRDVVLNKLDAWMSTPSRNQRPAPSSAAAIAGIWQFWLDGEMDISIIIPPDNNDFNDFPCGRNAIGKPLFDLIRIEDNAAARADFTAAFRAQDRIQNQRFVRRDAHREIILLVNGAPLFAENGAFEGYHCTVSDVSGAAVRTAAGTSTEFGALI